MRRDNSQSLLVAAHKLADSVDRQVGREMVADTTLSASGYALRGLLILAFCLVSGSLRAQQVEHLAIRQPGGMPGLPVLTGIRLGTNGVTVSWDGPPGYYQLYQLLNLSDEDWRPVGTPNLNRRQTMAIGTSNHFFRVAGPPPHFAGSQTCAECHSNIHDQELATAHAGALETLKRVGQGNNASCLPCHTVGLGLPTGFLNEASTPHLAGVQCENCHGPAANHAAREADPSVRPRSELAATVCGGCHTGSQHPTYEEWSTTRHANVTEDMNPANRIDSCGRCHSGSSRLALLKGDPLPVGDANVGIVCATCHDPHARRVFTNSVLGLVYTNQLRNPLHSTNDYFITTSGVFTNQYNPNINLCAQCHNHRGAQYTTTSRPPHRSLQYNMLLGTVGLVADGFAVRRNVHVEPVVVDGRRVMLTNQCVSCHMPSSPHQNGPPEIPAMTGHKFKVTSYESCNDCHNPLFIEDRIAFTTETISNRIQQVRSNLNLWAITKAPAQLRTKYGTRSWEYTNPGELSPGGPGPTQAEQEANPPLIPDAIKKARFNLYLVLHDGSFGVHNGPYAVTLLESARTWVQQELNK